MISRERLYNADKKARKRVEGWCYDIDNFLDKKGERISREEFMKKRARRMRKVTEFCSGPCCGNPRKWFGEVTNQEKRSNEALKQYHNSYENMEV